MEEHDSNQLHAAEQSVLGSLLLDNGAFDAVAALSERDFWSKAHRLIFRATLAQIQAGKPADVVTVAERLEAEGTLDEADGFGYVAGLAQNTPSSANISRYAEIVRDNSLLRRLASFGRETVDAATHLRNGRSARELLDQAQGKIMVLSEGALRQEAEFTSVGALVDSTLVHIDELSQRKNAGDVTGLATGFEDLDKMTTGLQPGDLVILAARPSMGKTAMALCCAENAAAAGRKVGFFSLEMTNGQLMFRLLSGVARLNQHRVKVGRLNGDEWDKLVSGATKVRSLPIWLNEQGDMTVNELKAQARRLHREVGGLDLLVVDYLQLMRGGGEADNRAQEVAEISRSLKGLAKELHVPLIALSQLNRSLESRPNKRPIMSDLRESGGIEQDADLILFIYRDEVYNEDSLDKGIAEIIIGKQRNGPTGTVFLAFLQELTRFENKGYGPIPSRQAREEKRAARATRGSPAGPHFPRGFSDPEDGS